MTRKIDKKLRSGFKALRYNTKYRITAIKHKNIWGLNEDTRDPSIIVSLTSFPARIKTVRHTIATLLNQTVKPDRVILWLAETQFPEKEKQLPGKLKRLCARGLEIRWCEDIKSYKKLIPALKEFPNDIIITVDDDMYYQNTLIEKLYGAYCKNASNIYALNTTKMIVDNKGQVVIDETNSKRFNQESYLNKLIGASGILYPPNCLYNDVEMESLFTKLAPTSDDIWFWFMGILSGTRVYHVGKCPHQYEYVGLSQHGPCLTKINDFGEKFFYQHLKALCEYYPQALKRLQEEQRREESR